MKILSITPYNYNSRRDKTNSKLSFTSLYNTRSASVLSKDAFTKLENISNPLNQAFWERLVNRFSCFDSEEISYIYDSCLNSNKIISKKAEEILYKMCDNIQDEKSQVYSNNGLTGVSILFYEAKDAKGNHNDENLDFTLWLDKNYKQREDIMFAYNKLEEIIKLCKNEKGICTEDNIFAIKQRINDEGTFSDYFFKQSTKDKFDDLEFYKKKYINAKHETDKSTLNSIIEAHRLNYYTADGMLKLLQELKNNKLLDSVGLSMPICENGDSILMSIPDIAYDNESKGIFKEIVSLLKEHQGIDYNQKNRFGVSFLEKIINSENIELLDLIKDEELTYNPVLESAYNRIQNMRFKDKIKDLSISFPSLELIVKAGNWEEFKKNIFLTSSPFFNKKTQIPKLYKLCPDNTSLQAYLKDYIQVLESFKGSSDYKIIDESTFNNIIDEHNINYYSAEGMLQLIHELKNSGLLNSYNLSMPICKNGDSILMSIPDIAYNNESKSVFKEIVSLLKEQSGINYNQDNNFGVSFLEKVINSENIELVELIKDKVLTYEPILECTYNGIQNPEFKEKVRELSISFPKLDLIAKTGNLDLFKENLSLLSSPLFNKQKQIPELYKLCPYKTPLWEYLYNYMQTL